MPLVDPLEQKELVDPLAAGLVDPLDQETQGTEKQHDVLTMLKGVAHLNPLTSTIGVGENILGMVVNTVAAVPALVKATARSLPGARGPDANEMPSQRFQTGWHSITDPVQKATAPRTVAGNVIASVLSYPFEKFEQLGEERGEQLRKEAALAGDSPELTGFKGAVIKTTYSAVPYVVLSVLGRGGKPSPKYQTQVIKDGIPIDIANVRSDIRLVNNIRSEPKPLSAPNITPVRPPIDDTQVQRGLAQRGETSPEVLPEHQAKLVTSPEAYYEPQKMRSVEETVEKLSTAELAAEPLVRPDGPANVGVAARLELYRRLVAEGNTDGAWQVMAETMKQGTSLGQLVNQFKLLKNATAEGVVLAVNKRLQTSGFDPLSPSQTTAVTTMSEASIKHNQAWKAAEREWLERPTDANLTTVRDARLRAIKADASLQTSIERYQPRNFWDMSSTLLKGNLLAPMSQMANVIGNTTNLLIRGVTRNVSTVVDMVDAVVRSSPREVAVSPVAGTKAALGAIKRSAGDVVDTLYRGASDLELAKTESPSSLHPLQALRDLFASAPDVPTIKGKVPLGQRLLMALEASPLSMHATAQLRLLAAADLPFRNAARARLITEQLKLSGEPLTPKNVRQAVEFPELFLDKKALDLVSEEALKAVYQQANPVNSGVNRVLASASPQVRFWVATIAPYVKTPTNIIGEWLSYNPAVAATNMTRAAVKGDTRSAKINAGKLVVGSTILTAGVYLSQKGLIGPSLDTQEEQEKGRMLSAQTLPPNHLNLSGLKRLLAGGDPSLQPGDETMNILRAGGVTGALLQNTADVTRRLEKQPVSGDKLDLALNLLGDEVTLTMGYGVNQSFLKNTSNLLSALSKQKADTWLATYVDSLTSIPLPNTLTALSRAMREHKPELRGDSLDQRLENQLKNRLGFLGLDQDLPLKRDLWGRPVKETEDSSTPLVAQFLDVGKSHQVGDDPLPIHLYSLWRRTASDQVIPTPPSGNLTVKNVTYKLTREQTSRLQELVGQRRYEIGQALIENPSFVSLPDAAQLQLLQQAWEKGSKHGKIEFLAERLSELEQKQQPQGLPP